MVQDIPVLNYCVSSINIHLQKLPRLHQGLFKVKKYQTFSPTCMVSQSWYIHFPMIKLYLNVILFSLQRLMGLPWIMLNLFLKKASKLLIWVLTLGLMMLTYGQIGTKWNTHSLHFLRRQYMVSLKLDEML